MTASQAVIVVMAVWAVELEAGRMNFVRIFVVVGLTAVVGVVEEEVQMMVPKTAGIVVSLCIYWHSALFDRTNNINVETCTVVP